MVEFQTNTRVGKLIGDRSRWSANYERVKLVEKIMVELKSR